MLFQGYRKTDSAMRTSGSLFIAAVFVAPGVLAQTAPSTETPTNIESLLELERRVIAAIHKTAPTVVAVQGVDKRFASGVIITPEGIVLSQFHVSHRIDATNASRKAGERLKVILYDGRECDAELLGADITNDLSLLRLIEPGAYPHASLNESLTAQRGDWTIKLGHPGGYVKGRLPVARMGRVVDKGAGFLIADCHVAGGDSGGPFFDLDGRLLGMVGVFVSDLANDGYRPTATNRPTAITSSRLIVSKTASMSEGRISGERPTYDGLPHGVKPLHTDEWRQGAKVLAAWRDRKASDRVGAWVVEVLNDDTVTAFGTIVAEDGWILTKASELPAEPKCHLPGGTLVSSQVVGVHPAFDLALLKLPAKDLSPVAWSDEPPSVAGTFVAAPSLSTHPLLAGIVGVPERDVAGPYPAAIQRATYKRSAASPPDLLGSPVQGRGYWIEFAEREAAKAGIRPGDVVLSIGGYSIRTHDDLAECVEGREAGQQVKVRLIREGKHVELDLALRSVFPARPPSVSFRRTRFPTVFEHDMPLRVNECGGPVINLRGEALGITICRVGGHGCLAIPASTIREILPDLKKGKPLSAMPRPRTDRPRVKRASLPRPVKTKRHVSISLDELKERLQERANLYKNLFVEYDSRTELLAEPRLLAAWHMNQRRDQTVRYEAGFAGDKRYHRLSLPLINMHAFPLDRVEPHKDAPHDVAERMRNSRQRAVTSKESGTFRHLFELNPQDFREQTTVFDGNECIGFFGKIGVPQAPGYFRMPLMYLAALGLRPVDPQVPDESERLQQQYRFPDSFGLYSKCEILPTEEIVDGAPCIVVETEWTNDLKEKGEEIVTDKIWFDPRLGFAPRRWEHRVNGRINTVRANSDFDEFAPGCWLPWESSLTHFAPAWVFDEFRDAPAYRFNMRLRKASVNLADSAVKNKFQRLTQSSTVSPKDAP